MNKHIKIDNKIFFFFEKFFSISSLCLKAKRVSLAHQGAVWLTDGEMQDVNPTEFEHVL